MKTSTFVIITIISLATGMLSSRLYRLYNNAEQSQPAIDSNDFSPVVKVTQDVSYLTRIQSHCLTTIVWYDGEILEMYLVYDGYDKPDHRNQDIWRVTTLTDSIKKSQFQLGEKLLMEEIKIRTPWKKD
jgi:hypothetical protein